MINFFNNLSISTKLATLIIFILTGFVITLSLSIYRQINYELETQTAAIVEHQKQDIAGKTQLIHQLASRVWEEDSKLENIEKHYQDKLATVTDATLSVLNSHYHHLTQAGATEEMIVKDLKDILRNVRYDNGTGYLFTIDLEGNIITHLEPEMEGKNWLDSTDAKGKYFVQEMIAVFQHHGQGFVRYYWNKPGSSEPQQKISYLTTFQPYQWIIGTGVYMEDTRLALQRKIADLIASYRYDIGDTKNNYFFILDAQGKTVRNAGFPHLNGADSSQFKDSQGKLFVQAFLKMVKESGQGFVPYLWPKPGHHYPSEKISYVQLFEPFQWVIATGVYLDEIGIEKATRQLQRKANQQIQVLLKTGLVFLCIGVVLSILLVHWITKPLSQARQAAEKIGQGHFGVEVLYHAHDEVGQLVQALNGMANQLQDSFTQLEFQNQELEELNRLKDIFLAELEEKRQELQEVNCHLIRLNQEKNEFLGIAAHDLKNPLQAIQGSAELIEKCFDDFLKEEIMEFAKMIGISSQRMFELVRTLLDVNAIESGKIKLSLQIINLLPILQRIVKEYQVRASLKNITVHFAPTGEEYFAYVDENIVYQVLDNLTSNAVKYCLPGNNVWISIDHCASGIRCEIQDEGPGLSPEDQQKLFNKFMRLTPRPTGGEHSTGLGLFIVKKLVDAMHGQVWCESEVGKGTIFKVEFSARG
jgi:signal transduction histidine kinase